MSKSNLSTKSILLFSVIVLLFSSCSKDDTLNPEYVGTWSSTFTDSGLQMKDNMTFTKDGFTDLLQGYYSATSKWINLTKITGSISVSGSTMTITCKAMGISTIDPVSQLAIGTIVMSDLDQPQTFTSEFSVSGNKMTMKIDHDGDGLYTDTNETTVYTKQ